MNVSSIDRGIAFDFGRTSALYAKYRDIYPPELYDRLRALGVGREGTCWVDVGTGELIEGCVRRIAARMGEPVDSQKGSMI